MEYIVRKVSQRFNLTVEHWFLIQKDRLKDWGTQPERAPVLAEPFLQPLGSVHTILPC